MKLIVQAGGWRKEVLLDESSYKQGEEGFEEICYEAGTQALECFVKYKQGDSEAIEITKQSEHLAVSIGWVLDVHEKDTESPDRRFFVLTECCLRNAGFNRLATEQRKEIEKCLGMEGLNGHNKDYGGEI